MRTSQPRESKRCNTNGRSMWTAGETIWKDKPHLVKFEHCIIVSLWTFQPTLLHVTARTSLLLVTMFCVRKERYWTPIVLLQIMAQRRVNKDVIPVWWLVVGIYRKTTSQRGVFMVDYDRVESDKTFTLCKYRKYKHERRFSLWQTVVFSS